MENDNSSMYEQTRQLAMEAKRRKRKPSYVKATPRTEFSLVYTRNDKIVERILIKKSRALCVAEMAKRKATGNYNEGKLEIINPE